jgi:hypothetical protein
MSGVTSGMKVSLKTYPLKQKEKTSQNVKHKTYRMNEAMMDSLQVTNKSNCITCTLRQKRRRRQRQQSALFVFPSFTYMLQCLLLCTCPTRLLIIIGTTLVALDVFSITTSTRTVNAFHVSNVPPLLAIRNSRYGWCCRNQQSTTLYFKQLLPDETRFSSTSNCNKSASSHSKNGRHTTETAISINTVKNWDDWCMEQLQLRYNTVMTLKCPFFRRRISDVLDAMDMMLQFLVIRHKSVSGMPFFTHKQSSIPLPQTLDMEHITSRLSSNTATAAAAATATATASTSRIDSNDNNNNNSIVAHTDKLYHISLPEILSIITNDWKVNNHKGYYVTGRLSTSIYHDDTIFDGPDPDMPVQGLYKYINAASQLFDTKHTFAELISIEQVTVGMIHDEDHDHELEVASTGIGTGTSTSTIVAKWKMRGKLRLPWKPTVPEWSGTTTYHIHPRTGLIYRHVETWDISVAQAFLQTLFPWMARRLYGTKKVVVA